MVAILSKSADHQRLRRNMPIIDAKTPSIRSQVNRAGTVAAHGSIAVVQHGMDLRKRA